VIPKISRDFWIGRNYQYLKFGKKDGQSLEKQKNGRLSRKINGHRVRQLLNFVLIQYSSHNA